MKKIILTLAIAVLAVSTISAQIGIGTVQPDASAALDVFSTTQGFLIPRMTMTQRDAIVSPATGLIVYQTDNTPGLYYNTGLPESPAWATVGSNAAQWLTNGTNLYYNDGNVGIGTSTPAAKLQVSGGDALLNELTAGKGSGAVAFNSAFGYQALYSNTTGHHNSAYGYRALYTNTTRNYNVAIGDSALCRNGTSATQAYHSTSNTAVGSRALYANTTGYYNSAVGYRALNSNTTGFDNCAFGYISMTANTTGQFNTAMGYSTLVKNISGSNNTSIGCRALAENTSSNNTAMGSGAMDNNNTGSNNTGIGYRSLYTGMTGSGNSALGSNAGSDFDTLTNCTFLGYMANSLSGNKTNSTAIGYQASINASAQVRIGNSAVTSIGGFTDWTNISDGRYKVNIRENVAGLEFIMKLRPVTYQMDANKLAADLGEIGVVNEDDNPSGSVSTEADLMARTKKSSIVYTGFIAQDVEAAALSAGFDFSGVDVPENEQGFYGLRYAEFVVPIVQAMQEQQQMIENLKLKNEELKMENQVMLKRIEALEEKMR